MQEFPFLYPLIVKPIRIENISCILLNAEQSKGKLCGISWYMDVQ